MFLIEWQGGKEIVGTWADAVAHRMFGEATVFRRWQYGWVAV
jgi:hypothetical protein